MSKFLGEVNVDKVDVEPYKNYNKEDFALMFIEQYSQIDGSHHKAWLIDQIARILKGSEIVIKKAMWENDQFEYRISVGKSDDYLIWENYMKLDGGYDAGIAP